MVAQSYVRAEHRAGSGRRKIFNVFTRFTARKLPATVTCATVLHPSLAIHQLAQCIDPWKVCKFQDAAKVINLSGIHLPFWRDWRFGNPAYFLTPEILHTLHKFFFDHISKWWCKEGLGQDELDSRYKSQHRRVGTRHFTNGVSHIKQMTGREHRDLQWTIVASIAGPVSSDFVHAIRALIDFIYKAQAPTFTDASITSMVESLAVHKDSIISAGLHRGASAIRNVGSLIQFTADVSERLHALQEPLRFDLCALLCERRLSLTNIIDEEFDEVADIDPMLGWILRGIILDDAQATTHVNVVPTHKNQSQQWVTTNYRLPEFTAALHLFLHAIDRFQTRKIMPSQLIQALPPSAQMPLGKCDTVLIHPSDASHRLPCVAQV
ncbi:hypothetical protein BS17DRAFT_881771 [Gyrodon lividus]|nr:hypothetical protein BS17DRAFT_881771 [Gyrodon lividus]